MKNKVKDYLATTALTIIAIAIVALFFKAKFIYTVTIFEVMFANIVVHFGLFLARRFNSKYQILEYIVELTSVLLSILVCGYMFKWFRSIPLSIAIIMVICIYSITCILDIAKTDRDINFINKQLLINNKRSDNH